VDNHTTALSEWKREGLKRKKTVLNLSNLKQDYKKFDFADKHFAQMLENTPVTEDIDSKIASCIIGLAKKSKE
jgi:hypothetical protein